MFDGVDGSGGVEKWCEEGFSLNDEQTLALTRDIDDRLIKEYMGLGVDTVLLHVHEVRLDAFSVLSGEVFYKVTFDTGVPAPPVALDMPAAPDMSSCYPCPGQAHRAGYFNITGSLDDFDLSAMEGRSHINAFPIVGDPSVIFHDERPLFRRVVAMNIGEVKNNVAFTLVAPNEGAVIYELVDGVITATEFVVGIRKSTSHNPADRGLAIVELSEAAVVERERLLLLSEEETV